MKQVGLEMNGASSLTRMTVEEYAAVETAFGEKVVKWKNTYWRRVRPLFYRPLIPFTELPPIAAGSPVVSLLGGFQHVVQEPKIANSSMNFLMFSDVQRYDLGSLDYNRKRQVKIASKQFEIRPIGEPRELAERGHPVYVSFLDRTGYGYKSERRDYKHFLNWAETLFQYPKAVILGGYRGDALCAVSVSYLVENILFYATFFCDDDSLRLNVSDLMLHTIRELAAQHDAVQGLYAGIYEGKRGTTDFYRLRGCMVISKPAIFRTNPVALLLLKNLMPLKYQQLIGDFKVSDEG
jgi:hypothetical protein